MAAIVAEEHDPVGLHGDGEALLAPVLGFAVGGTFWASRVVIADSDGADLKAELAEDFVGARHHSPRS